MQTDVTNLGDHLAILRRRWRAPVIGLVLGALVGLGFSLMQPKAYTAEARLLLEPSTASSTAVVMTSDEVSTQADVVASTVVAKEVIDETGIDESPSDLLSDVSVDAIEGTRVVAISVERPSAEEAAEIANAFADQYIAVREDANVRAAINSKQGFVDELNRVEDELAKARKQLTATTDSATAASLRARIRGLVALQAELNTEIVTAGDSTGQSAGLVLRSATVPTNPTQPRPVRNALMGGFLGLLIGVLVAYARDRFDDRITDEARLRHAVGTVPVIGRIPVDTRENPSRPAALVAPRSAVNEAFRALNTSVRFLTSVHHASSGAEHAAERSGKVVVITSAEPSEGKTSVAVNLAIAAARVGTKVLLVDADLRSPSVSDQLGILTPRGLVHVLAGQKTMREVIISPKGIDNLRIIGAGTVPPNPSDLLGGPAAKTFWDTARSKADLVIIDTAPVLQLADTTDIVPYADDVVFVVRHRHSRAHVVQSGIERIQQMGATVTGVVWTAVPGDSSFYGYGYGAGDE